MTKAKTKTPLPKAICLRLNQYVIALDRRVRSERDRQHDAHTQALATSKARGYLDVEDAYMNLRRAIARSVPLGTEQRWLVESLDAWWRGPYQQHRALLRRLPTVDVPSTVDIKRVGELVRIVGELVTEHGFKKHGAAAAVVDYLSTQMSWTRDGEHACRSIAPLLSATVFEPITVVYAPSQEIIDALGDLRIATARTALIQRILTAYSRTPAT